MGGWTMLWGQKYPKYGELRTLNFADSKSVGNPVFLLYRVCMSFKS